MTVIDDLPTEILLKVFRLLTRLDLEAAVLVSKFWNEVGEDPSLWNGCTLNISHGCDVYVLSLGRFKNVENIAIGYDKVGGDVGHELWQPSELQALFEAVIELPKLKEIERRGGIDLKLVDSDLLSTALVKMEDVGNFNNNDLTYDQYVTLFTKLAEKDTTLKKICFADVDLSRIEAELVSTAIAKLERMYMFRADINSQQAIAMFTAISQGTNLKKLLFERIDLSSVDPDVLASAVAKVEKVFLNYANLTTPQLTSILTRVQENTDLKYLNMKGNNAHDVDLNLVTRARVKLGEGLELDVFNDTDDNAPSSYYYDYYDGHRRF